MFQEGGSAWNSSAKADPRADVSVLAGFVPEGSRDPGCILARLANPRRGLLSRRSRMLEDAQGPHPEIRDTRASREILGSIPGLPTSR